MKQIESRKKEKQRFLGVFWAFFSPGMDYLCVWFLGCTCRKTPNSTRKNLRKKGQGMGLAGYHPHAAKGRCAKNMTEWRVFTAAPPKKAPTRFSLPPSFFLNSYTYRLK
jgi:hypothetical protein